MFGTDYVNISSMSNSWLLHLSLNMQWKGKRLAMKFEGGWSTFCDSMPLTLRSSLCAHLCSILLKVLHPPSASYSIQKVLHAIASWKCCYSASSTSRLWLILLLQEQRHSADRSYAWLAKIWRHQRDSKQARKKRNRLEKLTKNLKPRYKIS